MMRKLSVCICMLVCIIALSSCGQVLEGEKQSAGQTTMTDPSEWDDSLFLNYDIDIYDPLLGGAEGANLDATDALRVCPSLILILRYGDSSQWDTCYVPIDTLMEQFYQYGYLPREPYEGVGDFVSSMDAPLLGVTAELAYERSGDDRFRQYIVDLIPYMTTDTAHNGYVLKLNENEWWPLEYAWETVSEEDAWFVYNGSLFSMVCTEMLKNLTGASSLEEFSEKALNAYESRADEYLYADGSWCWYALNYLDGAPIIDFQEKIMIEMKSQLALYRLTGNSFYQEQETIRRELLAANLPIYVIQDGSNNQAYLLRACAPHPYDVDIYATTVEFLSANGEVVATAFAPDRTVDNSILIADIPDNVVSYRLYSRTNPVHDTLIVDAPVRHLPRKELNDRMEKAPAAGNWSISADSVSLEENTLSIAPGQSDEEKARIVYTFDEPVSYEQETYFALELTNHAQAELPNTMYFINDENGTELNRTGVLCYPGKNLLLYHATGFKGYNASTTQATSWMIQLITNSMTEESATVDLGNLYVFYSTAEVVEYLRNHSYNGFWIEK